jgi:hypothetical protein
MENLTHWCSSIGASHFYQQCIVAEEHAWMVSYNLEADAHLWFM